ncbi:MAG: ABC transporter permease [Halioglobus sp.]|nr:ABC transporter permease [Halioglobus sp.]
MSGIVYLAYRYLLYYRYKTMILLSAITLVIYLPAALQLMLNQAAEQLMRRAQSTPLLVGAKGSPLELVLNSLYFQSAPPATLPFKVVKDIRSTGLANAIPLHVRFHAKGFPVVGTSLDYFDLRGLKLAQGRAMALLGEAVVGAEVAAKLGLSVGDYLVTSPEVVFDLSGVYPLKMPVVGILSSQFSSDDGAIFVDVKTSWIIQGLLHGHQDINFADSSSIVLKTSGANTVVNASVVEYNEVTASNIGSFHLHGESEKFPLTAAIAVAKDQKTSTLLQGRFKTGEFKYQILRPTSIMQELLNTVFTIKYYAIIAMSFIGMSTFLVVLLVFALSVRLRRDEISTMAHLGGQRSSIFALLSIEVALILLLSLLSASLLLLLTKHLGATLLQSIVVVK